MMLIEEIKAVRMRRVGEGRTWVKGGGTEEGEGRALGQLVMLLGEESRAEGGGGGGRGGGFG